MNRVVVFLCLVFLVSSSVLVKGEFSAAVDFQWVSISLPNNPSGGSWRLYRQIKHSLNDTVNLVIDGALQDWSPIVSMARHPIPPEDSAFFQDMWLHHDSEYLYMRLRCADSFWDLTVHVLFDVDQNRSTGYNSQGLQIGADFVLEYSFFYKGVGRWNQASYDPSDPKSAWLMFWELGENVTFASDQTIYDTLELKIPLSVFGFTANGYRFGANILVKVNQDTFPTVAYAHRSPAFVEYGWHRQGPLLAGNTVFRDQVTTGLEYEYMLVDTGLDGAEQDSSVAAPLSIYVPYAYARSFNAMVSSRSSFQLSWIAPESVAVDLVRVVRSDMGFPANESDGLVVYEGSGTSFEDSGVITAKGYWWGIFSRSGARWSQQYWDCLDHSVAVQVRGPLPGITPSSDMLIYFANWDEDMVRRAERYDLIILHPGGGSPLVTPAIVRDLRDGVDNILGTSDDVIVIGYISVGEDYGMVNASRPWFNDPRSLEQLGNYYDDQKGPVYYDFETGEKRLSNGGFPSFYVDQWAYRNDGAVTYGTHGQDGAPDQNTEWGGLYVDSGNPLWQEFLKNATYDTFGVAGFDYILNTLDMDGVFLDTVGVSAPWSYWEPPSYLGDYFWIRDGHLDFLATIGHWYPDKYIIPNRPMHFTFPEFAAKRYDDFRAYANAILWESYTSDMQYWWRGGNGIAFERTVVNTMRNDDGMGVSVLILDYYSVDIQACEGGEYQNAPFYRFVRDEMNRSEALGFTTYVAPTRSLAEMDDFVYLDHHPEALGGLPDLHVHSILPAEKGSWNWACSAGSPCVVTIVITNRGADMPTLTSSFRVQSQWNNVIWADEVISISIPHGGLSSFNRTIPSLPLEGTNVRAVIDADAVLSEYSTSNNHFDIFLDQYFNISAGVPYKHPILPDVVVGAIDVSPPVPGVGETILLTAEYKNLARGTATASRMFIWLGSDLGGSQVGNIETPFLLDGDIKLVNFSLSLPEFGLFSASFICDGINKIPQLNRTNDKTAVQFFVVSTRDPLCDWNDKSKVAGPYNSSSDANKKLQATSLSSNTSHFIVRADFSESVSLLEYVLTVFMDTDTNTSTGYVIGSMGADYKLQMGQLYRYSGILANRTDWRWTHIPSAISGSVFSLEDSGRWSVAVRWNALSSAGRTTPAAVFVSLALATNNTVTELVPPDGSYYEWPMSCFDGFANQLETDVDCGGPCPACGPIVVDGFFDDWERAQQVKINATQPTDIFDYVSFTQTTQWFYFRLRMTTPINMPRYSYQIFFDVSHSNAASLSVNSAIDAQYMLTDGKLSYYTGVRQSWNWTSTGGGYRHARWAVGLIDTQSLEAQVSRAALGLSQSSIVHTVISRTDTQGTPQWQDDTTAWIPGESQFFDAKGILYAPPKKKKGNWSTAAQLVALAVPLTVLLIFCVAVVGCCYLRTRAAPIRATRSDA